MALTTAEKSDWVEIDNLKDSINLNHSNLIEGKITYRSSDTYSFFLKNDNDTSVFQKDLLTPKDGKFNDSTEVFSLELDTNLIPGKYTLSFYDDDVDSSKYSIADYHFEIIK